MLRQRVITAVAMLAVLLPALFHSSPWPFAGLTLVLIAAGAWELGRLNGLAAPAAWGLGLLCTLACLVSWQAGLLERPLPWLWGLAGLIWVLGGLRLLAGGVALWSGSSAALRSAVGFVALWLAWLAVAQARVQGINFLLSVLVLVWVADIAAYFAGKALGTRFIRRKLAPSISPGKSWEGALGGALGVLVVGAVWAWVEASHGLASADRSLYGQLAGRFGIALMVLGLLFLAAMSVVGDLVESLVKRSAGAKDSSGLLPGHGGVLDRVDALLPVLPLAMMLQGISR
jgi:phosphatidate cytidylyltransferase